MRSLFDQLCKDGESAIDRWIIEQTVEDLHFDCKCKANNSKSEIERDDRRNLGKTLSAFANSDGGLLLWGVDAREKDGVDRLVRKMPISQISSFRSMIEKAISELISPPIKNVEILEIHSNTENLSGFLAIYIAASESRPHMSVANTDAGFYFRNGHRSLLMEVYQVRDQMLRKTVPQLHLIWSVQIGINELTFHQPPIKEIPIYIVLSLSNNSTVSARFPYILINYNPVSRGTLEDNGSYNVESPPTVIGFNELRVKKTVSDFVCLSSEWEVAGGADCCIHPGSSMRMAAIKSVSPTNQTSEVKNGVIICKYLEPYYYSTKEILLYLSFSCLDMPCERQILRISGTELHSKILEKGQGGTIVLDPTPPARRL